MSYLNYPIILLTYDTYIYDSFCYRKAKPGIFYQLLLAYWQTYFVLEVVLTQLLASKTPPLIHHQNFLIYNNIIIDKQLLKCWTIHYCFRIDISSILYASVGILFSEYEWSLRKIILSFGLSGRNYFHRS